jgi:hypothetical protein
MHYFVVVVGGCEKDEEGEDIIGYRQRHWRQHVGEGNDIKCPFLHTAA